MNDVALTAEQIAIKIREDLDFFAAILIPDIATDPFPPFYNMVWTLILQNLHSLELHEIFRFALGLPRGHAKTTFIKLLVSYLIIHNYDINFIQIVCATEPLAENFLSDVHNMLQSPIITQVYGSWSNSLTRDTMKVKKASWLGRKIIIVAIGAGTSTRGLNLDNQRPQLIICDDAQTKENDESEVDRTKLMLWLVGTLFKSLVKRGKKGIIYVGNMYSDVCILYTFSKLPQWLSLITGGILADGTALWPAIQTVEDMLSEYEHDNALGLGQVWFAEVQNDPIGASASLLDYDDVVPSAPRIDYEDIELYPVRFICVDPAGMNADSDANTIAVHCIMEQGKAGTISIDDGRYSPGKVIEHTLLAALEWKVGIIFIENNAYQGSLAFWMEEAIAENRLNIKVIGLPSGSASKYRRIKAWTKQFVTGQWILFSHKVHSKVTYQLYGYKTNKKNNVDDILDVCAQGILAINKHGNEIYAASNQVRVEDSERELPQVINNSRVGAVLAALSHGR